MDESPPRAWAEINLEALKENYRFAKKKSGGKDVMAVVKANAYGHGVTEVVQALAELSPAFYGVANIAEAREVRNIFPESRVYLLGAANPTEYEEIVALGVTACASNMEELITYAQIAASFKKVFRVHIAVDTGMGRGGFLPGSQELSDAFSYSHPNIELEGVGSHLPVADEDEPYTLAQYQRFEKEVPDHLKYKHLANSAGIMHFSSETLNLIRPGLMLYGSSPIPEYQQHLKPVMRLCSRVSLIRKIPKGHGISYGRTYITERDSLIATIGIGYADGVLRSLSGKNARVSINGESALIVGRITMDQIMVDVTALKHCNSGDVVELFGENILVNEVAEKAGTIPWELFTGIAPRVKRVSV